MKALFFLLLNKVTGLSEYTFGRWIGQKLPNYLVQGIASTLSNDVPTGRAVPFDQQPGLQRGPDGPLGQQLPEAQQLPGAKYVPPAKH